MRIARASSVAAVVAALTYGSCRRVSTRDEIATGRGQSIVVVVVAVAFAIAFWVAFVNHDPAATPAEIDLRDRRGRAARLVLALLAGGFGGYASSPLIEALHLRMPRGTSNDLPFWGAAVVGIGVFAAVLAIANAWARRKLEVVARARVVS